MSKGSWEAGSTQGGNDQWNRQAGQTHTTRDWEQAKGRGGQAQGRERRRHDEEREGGMTMRKGVPCPGISRSCADQTVCVCVCKCV